MRAGPVTGPDNRIDSNMALRSWFHGDASSHGRNVSRFEALAGFSVGSKVDCPFGSLMMSRRVEENVAWRLTRPPQTTMAIRSRGYFALAGSLNDYVDMRRAIRETLYGVKTYQKHGYCRPLS